MIDLYRFFDADERLLYVGISLNAAKRASEHKKDKQWWSDVARMEVQHLDVSSRSEAEELERKAIRAERPVHNVMHNVVRLAARRSRPARRWDYKSAARARWPEAEWIHGNGPYACVAYCRVTTVILFTDRAEALAAKERIDRSACGGGCHHERGHIVTKVHAA